MANSETNSEVQLIQLQNCERRLGYEFRDKSILREAITHASISQTRLKSYERLEFLGDAILGFIVCEFLFQSFPEWLEGELTKVKSVVVSRQTCGRLGADLGLEEFLVVGKGIGNRGPVPFSLLANAFESIVGAIYLDGGMTPAKEFLLPLVRLEVEDAVGGTGDSNYKSELQQYAQKRLGLPPNYHLVGARGPDHEKWFMVVAQVGKRKYPPAWGRNKKEAEQRAAANALAEISGDDPPFRIDDDDSQVEAYENGRHEND